MAGIEIAAVLDANLPVVGLTGFGGADHLLHVTDGVPVDGRDAVAGFHFRCGDGELSAVGGDLKIGSGVVRGPAEEAVFDERHANNREGLGEQESRGQQLEGGIADGVHRSGGGSDCT